MYSQWKQTLLFVKYEMDIYIKGKIIFFYIIRAGLQSLKTFKENNAL